MRRREREITDKATIEKIISLCRVCRVGLYDGSAPYVVPVNFYYSEGTVYFHSAGSGKKIECVKSGGAVALEWDIPGDLLTAEKPCDSGFEYVSVIAAGRPFFIESDGEKARILTALTARYFEAPGSAGYRGPVSPRSVGGTAVVGIELDELTGKASSEEFLSAVLDGSQGPEK